MIFAKLALVPPLVRVHVMPTRSILEPDGRHPVAREGDCSPRLARGQLFLPDVMIQAAAVDTHTAAEHQGVNSGAVHQVVVVPMIDPGTDDDGAFAAGMPRRITPLARKADERIA